MEGTGTIKCVLLPGLDGTGQLFQEFSEAIAKFSQPIIIAYPNDRLLVYEQLANFVIDRLPKDGPYCLVAESFSGPVAILVASRNPPGLKCVVMVATFAKGPWPSWIVPISNTFPLFAKLPVPRILISHFLLNGMRPELAAKVQNLIRSMRKSVVAHRAMMAIKCDFTDKLDEIAVPTLLVRAGHDRIIPRSRSAEMHNRYPSSQLITLQAPHFVLQTIPIEAASQIKSFLERNWQLADAAH